MKRGCREGVERVYPELDTVLGGTYPAVPLELVPGFGMRVSGSGFRNSGFGMHFSGFGMQVPGFDIRDLRSRFRDASFRRGVKGFRVSGSSYVESRVGATKPAYRTCFAFCAQ